jgi:predicted PurR-regulated permease PerM
MKKRNLIFSGLAIFFILLIPIIITQSSEYPQWSNLKHEPQIVTILDDVTLNVTWYSNESLNTVIIYENSTGSWVSHIGS